MPQPEAMTEVITLNAGNSAGARDEGKLEVPGTIPAFSVTISGKDHDSVPAGHTQRQQCLLES